MKYLLSTIVFLLSFTMFTLAQGSLLDQLEAQSDFSNEKVAGTFKGTRLINGHSVEMRKEGTLDFLISHRFGRLNSGAYSFFGLDEANIRLGLDYAISDNLTVGIGRNSLQKIYDGFFKYKILWQGLGTGSMPISMVWFSNTAVNSLRRADLPMEFKRRLAYTHQLLISRKFSEHLSIQLMPALVHRNMVPTRTDTNDLFVLGVGGRYKLTPSTALNAEYFYRLNGNMEDTYNALSIGFDIETGGHVFQLHVTNAQAMTESLFIPATSGNFFKGDIHFGFNISRTFQVKHDYDDY